MSPVFFWPVTVTFSRKTFVLFFIISPFRFEMFKTIDFFLSVSVSFFPQIDLIRNMKPQFFSVLLRYAMLSDRFH